MEMGEDRLAGGESAGFMEGIRAAAAAAAAVRT